MTERLFVRLDDDPLYAPETSVPSGTLREFAVPGGLREWVAHVIAYEEEFPAGEEVRERVLPDGSVPWASIAADCGFSDQSHLINEFRMLCGLTPAQFVQRVAAA